MAGSIGDPFAARRGGGRRRRRGGRRALSEINVTPLVDVMLVLLIIFMVTAPLMTAGVPVNLPDSRAKALDQDQKPVDIAVDRDGTIHIGDDAVTMEELPDRLSVIASERRQGDKPPQIFLRADKALDYGRVMEVMGELNRAGLNRVALVSNAKERR